MIRAQKVFKLKNEITVLSNFGYKIILQISDYNFQKAGITNLRKKIFMELVIKINDD